VTGSGKTLAFAIPTVARTAASGTRTKPGHPRALVLVPTRELANQVATVIAPLAAAVSLRCSTVFGGVSQSRQVAALRSGVDILIACPGRLEDLLNQRQCSLAHVSVTVLDEADHMADLGFLPAVRRLLDTTPQGQRLLFSATLDNAVDALVRRYIRDPRVHSVEPPADSGATTTHHLLAVSSTDKPAVIREIAGHASRVLMFTRTKHGAKKLSKQLTTANVPTVELHGNLSQGVRERNLDAFASGRARVLVATDIAARGIHVDNIDLVVHVDPPAEHKAYLHRSGRTARAGADGVVVTLMLPEQADDVRRLTRTAGISPSTTQVTAGHPLLASLTDRREEPRQQTSNRRRRKTRVATSR
jgi:superfamily II DNA/RNA helicase